jgi:hypothetical protein
MRTQEKTAPKSMWELVLCIALKEAKGHPPAGPEDAYD